MKQEECTTRGPIKLRAEFLLGLTTHHISSADAIALKFLTGNQPMIY